jgi:hypothetical protein
MTLLPVTNRREIEAAYGEMTQRLQARTQAFDRKIGYHSGYVEHEVHWHSGLGFWWLLNRTVANNRWWCCYGIEDPEHKDMLSITVETNSPFEGVNRRIGGLFVKDEAGRVYIAHSGKVGGGRPGIGKEAFWEAYGGEQVETVRWPDGQESRAIVIAPVDSERLPVHIGRFVHEVAQFKAAVASGKPVARRERVRRIFTPEFEGPRRGYSPAGEIEARCDHGIVVNRLHETMKAAGHDAVNDRRDLYILARDEVTHLFEVKTDVSTTSLYQGVGQLMLHGAALDPVPRRILVVPSQPAATTLRALERLGIAVLTYEWVNERVEFPDLHTVTGRKPRRRVAEPSTRGGV